jgi:hypothetical protein
MAEVEKLQVTYKNGEVEIIANRAGLKGLAEICLGLSDLVDDEAKTGKNHYHYADFMNNAEPGSVPMLITLRRE